MSNLNSMELKIEAKSQNEKFARSVVGAFFATLEQLEDVKTAVSEAVTNCIVHAYGGKQQGEIRIRCNLTADTLFVEVVDFGKGIEDVEKAMTPFFTTVDTLRNGFYRNAGFLRQGGGNFRQWGNLCETYQKNCLGVKNDWA